MWRGRKSARTAFRLAIAASAVILALGGLGWFWDQRNTYATDVGEQRTVALQDGTAVVLNARSRIRVRLSEKQRDIDLLEGQAIFRVSHDAARPFIVHSGSTNVRAVGTQFDVYRKADGTIVTVLEGTVAVRESGSLQDPGTDARPSAPGALSRGSVLVSAGEQITVSPHATTTPKPTDLDIATAWTQGKLVFNETPLGDVVAEFNRYSARQLVVDDPELQKFHISGVFPSSDPIRIAELLQQRFGVTIRQNEHEIPYRALNSPRLGSAFSLPQRSLYNKDSSRSSPAGSTSPCRGMGALMRSVVVATAVSLLVVGFAAADPATASIRKHTEIAAQDLGTALQQFMKERDLHLVYVSEDLRNLRTAGVAGELTTAEALDKLLGGTGLVYRYLDEKTVLIVPQSSGGFGTPAAQAEQVRPLATAADRPARMASPTWPRWSRRALRR